MLTELVLGEEAQLGGSWRVDSRKGEGLWRTRWPWLHMMPLELLTCSGKWHCGSHRSCLVGKTRCVRPITGEREGPERLKELPRAT